jgi:D-alanyl-D-alanine carboxypeptidase-like protein
VSRGPADKDGNRTQLSNHSYGVAIDVNEMQNGLYDHCVVWGAGCRLIKGGPYRPREAGSIVAESPLVAALEAVGLKWGGRIAGRQKDFMHFSPTGY